MSRLTVLYSLTGCLDFVLLENSHIHLSPAEPVWPCRFQGSELWTFTSTLKQHFTFTSRRTDPWHHTFTLIHTLTAEQARYSTTTTDEDGRRRNVAMVIGSIWFSVGGANSILAFWTVLCRNRLLIGLLRSTINKRGQNADGSSILQESEFLREFHPITENRARMKRLSRDFRFGLI